MEAPNSMAGEITRRILATIPVRADDNTPRVNVAIEGSCATLTGDVHTWEDHELAGRIAAAVPGIDSVDNQLCLFVKGKLATF